MRQAHLWVLPILDSLYSDSDNWSPGEDLPSGRCPCCAATPPAPEWAVCFLFPTVPLSLYHKCRAGSECRLGHTGSFPLAKGWKQRTITVAQMHFSSPSIILAVPSATARKDKLHLGPPPRTNPGFLSPESHLWAPLR